MQPTEEQQYAIDLFTTGKNLVIQAGAGTGKTSTLQMVGRAAGNRRGLYLAFNRRIADDAAEKFRGTNVEAMSMHSLAYKSHGAPLKPRISNGEGTIFHAGQKAVHLGVEKYVFASGSGAQAGALSPQKTVGVVTATVHEFMLSADDTILPEHVTIPTDVSGLRGKHEAAFRAKIVEYAQRYWADLIVPDGKLRFSHAVYFKLWAISHPKLTQYDFIMLDEAQDADRVITGVLREQEHAQIIVVGDAQQQIYSWRGSLNSMDSFDGDTAMLTRSFRFGPKVAEYANRWLTLLGSSMRLRGSENIASQVAAPSNPRHMPNAILCRTNAGAISEIVAAQRQGYTVGIAGERKAFELADIARDALDLQRGRKPRHAELKPFNTWSDVVAHSQGEDGADLKPLVDVIERVGAQVVIDAVRSCVPTGKAQVIVSTAHVSKGLEWRYVRIANDFRAPSVRGGSVDPMPAEEARLAYVAATRAQVLLDMSGLAWLDEYLAAGGWVEGGLLPDDGIDGGGTVHMEGEGAPSATQEEKKHHV